MLAYIGGDLFGREGLPVPPVSISRIFRLLALYIRSAPGPGIGMRATALLRLGCVRVASSCRRLSWGVEKQVRIPSIGVAALRGCDFEERQGSHSVGCDPPRGSLLFAVATTRATRGAMQETGQFVVACG